MVSRQFSEMSRRKEKYQKKRFESTDDPSDVFAGLYRSMLISNAWKALTTKQHELYVYCKLQYYAEKRKPNDDKECFTMNWHKVNETYCLYKSDRNSFYRDISALISKGFIKCVECGSTTRTKSIYKYSDMWQKYGTPDFVVEYSDMTSAMVRKVRKEQEHG